MLFAIYPGATLRPLSSSTLLYHLLDSRLDCSWLLFSGILSINLCIFFFLIFFYLSVDWNSFFLNNNLLIQCLSLHNYAPITFLLSFTLLKISSLVTRYFHFTHSNPRQTLAFQRLQLFVHFLYKNRLKVGGQYPHISVLVEKHIPKKNLLTILFLSFMSNLLRINLFIFNIILPWRFVNLNFLNGDKIFNNNATKVLKST